MGETRLFARATPVFSAEHFSPPTSPGIEPVAAAEAFIAATGASIVPGTGDRAYYRPSTDSIQVLAKTAFVGIKTSTPQKASYSTLLHELTHWTSPKRRCKRALGKRFGDVAYAKEELDAELVAASSCADLRIAQQPRLDHTQ